MARPPLLARMVALAAALVTLFAYLFALRVSSDHQVLEELASLDALTGLPNRRMMESALEEAVALQRIGKRNHGLLIADIDHFKEVNDTHGHAAGDAAIADLAAILKFEMRRHDKVFRFGGEEFAIVFPGRRVHEVWPHLESLREQIAAHALVLRSPERDPSLQGRMGATSVSVSVSVSIGLAERGERAMTPAHVLIAADRALYRAKHKGRNRLSL